jgi:hypothetical protein
LVGYVTIDQALSNSKREQTTGGRADKMLYLHSLSWNLFSKSWLRTEM